MNALCPRAGLCRLLACAMVLLSSLLSGCIPMTEINTSLGTTRVQASADIARMKAEPKAIQRPVLVLNGYRALPTLSSRIARKLRAATSGNSSDFLAVSYTLDSDFDSIVATVIREVEAKWPCADPDQTVELDVVGISMGGLVARWASLPPNERVRGPSPAAQPKSAKRLRIVRLFTLGTPHAGATMADSIAPDPASRDMRSRSPFLAALDARLADAPYELICYAQLRDHLSGATRCAPVGQLPIWTSGTFMFSHLNLADNPVFLADIAKRLREEPPFLKPGSPPPRD